MLLSRNLHSFSGEDSWLILFSRSVMFPLVDARLLCRRTFRGLNVGTPRAGKCVLKAPRSFQTVITEEWKELFLLRFVKSCGVCEIRKIKAEYFSLEDSSLVTIRFWNPWPRCLCLCFSTNPMHCLMYGVFYIQNKNKIAKINFLMSRIF